MFQLPTRPPGQPHRTGSFPTFAAMENSTLAPCLIWSSSGGKTKRAGNRKATNTDTQRHR
ncbi:hypothetical protein CGRA01v4_06412 [Colletotrichum graminicola]|nr:hypothetical protein CGRA01v4_06412 [Colletotrichum graminicola]